MKTEILLMRHAQSVGNAKRIYLGHTDLPLTEEGVMQAHIAAEHLKDRRIDAVYSSDLQRAYQTALPHARIRGLEVNTSRELREMFVGDWEGGDVNELLKLEDFTVRRTHRDFVYPNGEGTLEAACRAREEILKIAQRHLGETVLIVSHSAVIRAFWYNLCRYTEQNMTDRVKFMPNAAYCVLEFDGESLVPLEYYHAEHLPATKVHPV